MTTINVKITNKNSENNVHIESIIKNVYLSIPTKIFTIDNIIDLTPLF
jgi:hypothetical protein